MMEHLSLSHFLVVGGLLFCFGLMTVLTRRNAVAMLMGIELILNGANVNLVAFNHYVAVACSGRSSRFSSSCWPLPRPRWGWPLSWPSTR